MGALSEEDVAITEQAESAAQIHTAQHAFKVTCGPRGFSMSSDANLTINERKRVNLLEIGIVPEKPNFADLDFLGQGMESLFYEAADAKRASSTTFDSEALSSGPNYSSLETDLRQAVERRELRVYYQPIVMLDTGQITGFEALVRWQHPTQGLLSPAEFIHVAEKTGLIVSIGAWVLREACSQMRLWHQRFVKKPPLLLCVNYSSKLFQQADLVEQVCQILNETGLKPQTLKLEITETMVMENPELVRTKLLQFRALNVQLGIDDFGTGYSSLSYLQKFPVHTLKIDRSFIGRLENDKENLEIVRAIVTLAHNLGLDVVAEGVETEAQFSILKMLNCEFGQGYLFARPVDAKEAEDLLMSDQSEWIDMPRREVNPAQRPQKGESGNGFLASPLNPSIATKAETTTAVTSQAAVQSQPNLKVSNHKGLFIKALSKPFLQVTGLVLAGILGVTLLSMHRNNMDKPKPVQANSETALSVVEKALPVTEKVVQKKTSPFSIREVEVAMASGKYVTPPLANAVYYCNRILAVDPNNLETQKLKEKSAQKAMAQARQIAQSGKSDEARELYSTLLKLSQDGSRFPYSPQELKKELQKNEMKTYSVVHDHFAGGCQGKLEFNSYVISYVPSQNSKDGFSEMLGQVSIGADGAALRIKLPNKVYRFKVNSSKNKDEQKSQTDALYLELSDRIEENGTTKINSKG